MFPVVSVYAHNQHNFLIAVLPVPILASWIVVGVATAIFFLLLKNMRKAALMAAACYGVVVLYNPIFELLTDVWIVTPVIDIGPNKIIGAAAFAILGAAFVALYRARSPLTYPTIVANVVAATILLPPVINIAHYNVANVPTGSAVVVDEGADSTGRGAAHIEDLPDIYHFVLDAYARWDIYKDYFNFDNDRMRTFLEANKFIVSDRSRSNYTKTALTFASMLNLDYVQNLLGNSQRPDREIHYGQVFRLIQDNVVFTTLLDAGYQVHSFDSGVAATDFSKRPIITLSPGSLGMLKLDEFQSELLNLTPIPAALSFVFGEDYLSSFALQRARIEYAFDNVGKASTLPDQTGDATSPVYTLVHILGPHWPHLYRADGTHLNPTEAETGDFCVIIGDGGISADVYMERHVEYVKYLNQRIIAAIERILQNPERRPVILISSDHGSRSSCDASDPMNRAYLRERTANLYAAYIPDAEIRPQFADLTPVNYYRALFNAYLGTRYRRLPDKVYNTPTLDRIELVDVTESTAADG